MSSPTVSPTAQERRRAHRPSAAGSPEHHGTEEHAWAQCTHLVHTAYQSVRTPTVIANRLSTVCRQEHNHTEVTSRHLHTRQARGQPSGRCPHTARAATPSAARDMSTGKHGIWSLEKIPRTPMYKKETARLKTTCTDNQEAPFARSQPPSSQHLPLHLGCGSWDTIRPCKCRF